MEPIQIPANNAANTDEEHARRKADLDQKLE